MTQYGYDVMHKRLRRLRGSASRLLCIDCGVPANEWSYDGLDPDEMFGKVTRDDRPMAFSLRPEHYDPRCFVCHSAFDRPKQDNCPKCGGPYRRDSRGWAKCPRCHYDNRIAKGEVKRPGIGRSGDRTHCPAGHCYDEENTYVATTARGGINRMCRECMRQRNRARRAAIKEGDAL